MVFCNYSSNLQTSLKDKCEKGKISANNQFLNNKKCFPGNFIRNFILNFKAVVARINWGDKEE